MITFRQATTRDGDYILNNLRVQESKTIEKLGIDPNALLARALFSELPSWTCLVDGIPAAIFGATADTLLGEPRLWMLTTPLIERHQVPLLRASKMYVQRMAEVHGSVVGMVDAEFEKSKAWLRWIGFKEVKKGDYIVMRYSHGN
jgi:hypothetical protein